MGPADGYAKRRETFGATVVREVKEETGLDVTVGPLVQLTSGYQLLEVLEAGWFPVTELPAEILPAHRQLIKANTDWYAASTNATETTGNRTTALL